MAGNQAYLIQILIIAIFVGLTGGFASAAEMTATNETTPAVDVSDVDLVCGMTVDPSTAKFSDTFEGKTYYFCSAMCKDQFAADPSKFVSAIMNGTVSDPVCRMKVSPDTAEATATVNGTEYFFCSPDCKAAFEANPEKYLNSPDGKLVACPVCGMSVDSSSAVNSSYKDTTYYFCCSKCKGKFDADPEAFLSVKDETSATDMVCGMTVDPKSALSTEYNGKMYYFCNPMCKEEFDKDPKSFLMK